MYFNTAVKDNTEISELLQYFENTDSENRNLEELSERVRFYKENEEGVKHMCEAVRNYGNERESKGQESGAALKLVTNIKNLMNNTKCSLEEALSMIGCSVEEYNKSLEIVENIND